ncbi:hypothetical protein [Natronosalvus vescus]|uniref:hypothetical protein n=1 Tax=Natronosalvus vescus TaxID=2953881 RepID=UPI002091A1F7|nr:hypothetical protein [Natronosalvus vescus]
MGRTNPTYRDALRGLEREWAPMRRALRRERQADFDRLFDRARTVADAAGYANTADPERALVLSLLVAHETALRELEVRVSELEGAASIHEAEADAGDGDGGSDCDVDGDSGSNSSGDGDVDDSAQTEGTTDP